MCRPSFRHLSLQDGLNLRRIEGDMSSALTHSQVFIGGPGKDLVSFLHCAELGSIFSRPLLPHVNQSSLERLEKGEKAKSVDGE